MKTLIKIVGVIADILVTLGWVVWGAMALLFIVAGGLHAAPKLVEVVQEMETNIQPAASFPDSVSVWFGHRAADIALLWWVITLFVVAFLFARWFMNHPVPSIRRWSVTKALFGSSKKVGDTETGGMSAQTIMPTVTVNSDKTGVMSRFKAWLRSP